ncbi:MAG: hypothetical protein RMJ56_03485 [Gemmataceae bacterium]|nr:hypothetical protein [Gemmataceae bacterium]
MVDVGISGHKQFPPGSADAQAQVIVIEKADAEALVKSPDTVEYFAPRQQAETCHSSHFEHPSRVRGPVADRKGG